MSDKPKPTEAEINYAIEYALRCEPITVEDHDEGCGGWGDYANLTATELQPFAMRLLQALNVI